MPWSTSELASLAGTTVNTVRHYHRAGLLDEPERRFNGYRSYDATHLLRLLQIRRLREIGVPLDQIEEVAFGERPAEALRAIDGDLDREIDRLQRMRADIGSILRGNFATWLPAGFESVAHRLSLAEKSTILLATKLYDENAMADVRQMLIDDPDDGEEFDALAPDADEATRSDLVERYAETLEHVFRRYPWLNDPTGHLHNPPAVTQAVLAESLTALYNPAQRDVMARANALARARMAAGSASADAEAASAD